MTRRRSSSILVAFISAFVALLAAGCSYDSEVIRDAPESEVIASVDSVNGPGTVVSSLQRIVLMPFAVEPSLDDPDKCMVPCNPTRDRTEMVLSSVDHLERRLGYDIVCLDVACRTVSDNPYTQERLKEWAKALGEWSGDNIEALQLPPSLLEVAGQLKSTFDADGIIVVHGKARYATDASMLHWLATLTVSMYYDLLRGNTAKLQADIYSTNDGTKLWSAKTTVSQIGQPESQAFPVGESVHRYGVAIFGALDMHSSMYTDAATEQAEQ